MRFPQDIDLGDDDLRAECARLRDGWNSQIELTDALNQKLHERDATIAERDRLRTKVEELQIGVGSATSRWHHYEQRLKHADATIAEQARRIEKLERDGIDTFKATQDAMASGAALLRSSAARIATLAPVPTTLAPTQPEHDTEVEDAVRETCNAIATISGPVFIERWALEEDVRRAVQAGRRLGCNEGRSIERAEFNRGQRIATAKAEGYREGREQGAKDMLDSTMDTLAAGAQRLNAERNKLEADAHATGYREGLAAGKAGGSQELSSAELVMHYVRAEREACARLVYLWTEPFDRRLISAAICARGEPTPQGSDS